METEDNCTGLRVQHGRRRDEKTLKEKSLLVKEPSGIRAGGVADKETATINTEKNFAALALCPAQFGVFKGGRYVSRDYGDSDA
jgi:hypothetical protein